MYRIVLMLLIAAITLTACPFEKEEQQAAPAPISFGMPTLVDKSLEEATEICTQWDMDIAVIEERCDHDASVGSVLSQWPKPSDDAFAGMTAVVIVSKKAEMVRMPNLHNCTVAQAQNKLDNVGLRIHPRKAYRYDGSVHEGRLLDYDPGKRVYAGSEVQVVVSKGPIPTGEGEVRSMRLSE